MLSVRCPHPRLHVGFGILLPLKFFIVGWNLVALMRVLSSYFHQSRCLYFIDFVIKTIQRHYVYQVDQRLYMFAELKAPRTPQTDKKKRRIVEERILAMRQRDDVTCSTSDAFPVLIEVIAKKEDLSRSLRRPFVSECIEF